MFWLFYFVFFRYTLSRKSFRRGKFSSPGNFFVTFPRTKKNDKKKYTDNGREIYLVGETFLLLGVTTHFLAFIYLHPSLIF